MPMFPTIIGIKCHLGGLLLRSRPDMHALALLPKEGKEFHGFLCGDGGQPR